MATALDFIKSIAARAGIKDNQEFDLALAGSAADTLKGLELPDSVINQVNTNLMDFNTAKSNLDLKNHFTGMAFNGMESAVFDQLKASGFDDAEIEGTIVDQKVENLLGVLEWDIPSHTDIKTTFDSLFSFT